jgi:hypothetical protein
MSYKLGMSSHTAVKQVRGQGFSLPDEPEFNIPELPPDITAINSEELMVLFGQFESWLSYVEVQLAAAEIDEKGEQTALDIVSAGLQIDNKGKAKTVSELKSIVMMDEGYARQEDKVSSAYAYRKVIETIYRRLDRAKFLVSRELTRRTYTKD